MCRFVGIRFVGIVTLLGLVGFVPVSPGPASAAAPSQIRAVEASQVPVLGAVNRIRGSKSGVVRVRLDTPAVFSGNPKDFSVSGRGRLPGFLLVSEERESAYDHPILGPITYRDRDVIAAGVRLPARGVWAGAAADRKLIFGSSDNVIPPGEYFVYLVADGTPVDVTFRLTGPLGSADLKPDRRARHDSRRLEDAVDVRTPAASVWSAGSYSRLFGEGLVFFAMTVEVENSSQGDFGECLYRGRPSHGQGPNYISYGPKCVGGLDRDSVHTAVGYVYVGSSASGKATLYGMTWGSLIDKDEWTQTVYFDGQGEMGRAAGLAYWLTF